MQQNNIKEQNLNILKSANIIETSLKISIHFDQ